MTTRFIVVGFDEVDLVVGAVGESDSEEILTFDDWSEANQLATAMNSTDRNTRWEAIEIDFDNQDDVSYYTHTTEELT